MGTSPVPTPVRRATCSENPPRPAGPDKAFPCADACIMPLVFLPRFLPRAQPLLCSPLLPFPFLRAPLGLQLACTEPRRPQPGPRHGDLLPRVRGLLGQRLTQPGSRGRPTLAGAEDAAAPVPAAPRLPSTWARCVPAPRPASPKLRRSFRPVPLARGWRTKSLLARCLPRSQT